MTLVTLVTLVSLVSHPQLLPQGESEIFFDTDDLGTKFTRNLLCTSMLQMEVHWHLEMYQEGTDNNLPTYLRLFSWGRFAWASLGIMFHKVGSQMLPEVEGVRQK